MSQPRPSFFDSPYFSTKYGNWHLKDDAPEELKKEFEEYMKESSLVIEGANHEDGNKR